MEAEYSKSLTQKSKSGYWYETHIYECVLCGYCTVYKNRVYDKPKPKDWRDRNHYHQTACDGHFI